MRRATTAALFTLVTVAAAACSSSGGGSHPSTTSNSRPAASTSTPAVSSSHASSTSAPSSPPPHGTTTTTQPKSTAERALAAMSLKQRVGQLIMVDCPSTGVSQATRAAITSYRVGSVILDGTSQSGLAATRSVTAQLRGLAPRGVGLFIATDQEGGQVQRLQGPGFSPIPSAVVQGGTAADTLRRQARQWGDELRQAGINVNLAPVLDTVPSGGGSNPPIGDLDRQYGNTPTAVAKRGLAFARGMGEAGIDATVKHFPGLGRVGGNTDTSGGVRDTVTSRNDAYLAPFRAAARAGVPFLMMSTAIYSKIDSANPAAFSPTIIGGMVRGDLGYRGVVISDDVGAASQVAQYSPGQRAVRFVAAGGDVVLTVVATQAAAMTEALLRRAKSDATFRKKVDTAVLRVLRAKHSRDLLT